MKNLYMRMFAVSLLLIIALVGVKDSESGEKAWIGEPIFISHDASISNWCGPDALIYGYQESSPDRYIDAEVYWYDINTGRKVLIGKESDELNIIDINCTPDGKWFVYRNQRSARIGENKNWYIQDLWRYEVATAKHEKIAITHAIPTSQVSNISPDGKKLFLGRRPHEEIEMPEPKLELIWTEVDETSGALWLQDSSAVLMISYLRRDGDDDLVTETVELERGTTVFNPEGMRGIGMFYSDSKGRIYRYYWDSDKKIHVARCTLNQEERSFVCEDIFVEGKMRVNDFEVFLDGEAIAFTEANARCVKAIKVGTEKAYCITPPIDRLGNYRVSPGAYIGISSDSRWLTFDFEFMDEAGKLIRVDQYVIELNKEYGE